MTTYLVNINRNISNVKVYTIKKSVKGETNKFSKVVESLIQKYILKEKPEDSK
jgi:hypothetical protein